MIWQLMKRDAAWRWLPWLTLGSAVFCLLWQWQDPRETGFQSGIPGMIFLGVFSLLAYAASYAVAAQQDDTRLQSTLPMTVRQIYLARTISVIAILWIPVLAGAVMGVRSVLLLTLVDFVSVFTLAVAGIHSAMIRGFAIPRAWIRGSFMFWAFGTISVPLIFDLPDRALTTAKLIPLICWLCIVVVFLTTWLTAPVSFQTAPLRASARVPGKANIGKTRTSPFLSVWLSLFRGGGLWVCYIFIGSTLFGTAMSTIIFAASLWPMARTRARWLLAMPVSLAACLPVILLPYFLAFGGGYLISIHRASFTNTEERRITVRASQEGFYKSWPAETPNCKTMNIIPALEFWVPAEAGKAPLIQAPWGETFQPPTAQRFGFDVYNPYAVGCANSERFFDWQFSRATLTVYGRSIALREFPVGDVVDTHLVITGIRTQVIGLAVIAGYLILGVAIPVIGDWYRFRSLALSVRIAIYVLAGAAGVALFFCVLTERFDIVQWLAWALPSGLPETITVAVLVLAVLYWVTYKLFTQLEFIDKPVPPNG